MKYIFLLAILFSCSSTDHYAHFSEDCRDFLKDWKASHEKIKFAGCKKEDPSMDQPRLIATYRVDGRDAKEVETYLMDKFGMKPLSFECCGYVPKSKDSKGRPFMNVGRGMFKDAQYREYFTVNMMSKKETKPKDWELINFIVEIETYYKGI